MSGARSVATAVIAEAWMPIKNDEARKAEFLFKEGSSERERASASE